MILTVDIIAMLLVNGDEHNMLLKFPIIEVMLGIDNLTCILISTAILDTVWRKILAGEIFDEWAFGKIRRKNLTNSMMLTPTFINGYL